ncbi:hypothetical protein FHT32_003299 [Variovorax sp. SG517]|uniref:antitoxin VbhA family protein n=1 Tax=Variovorax sp. SG517 TaxID=2587117 RepID=UPI00159E558F|nr:antitoxin VbhA family protein [Variovorax sp. SG517]NVM89642.1 hypothetical protein [Variovorax sp. SG517]
MPEASVGNSLAAEKMRRKKAYDSAIASVGLEGFKVPKEYADQAQRFVNGEIDFDVLGEFLHKRFGLDESQR